MTKNLFIKTKVATIASALMFTSVNVNALGLGVLDVQSNLDQPLDAYIELRVNSGDDINSVKASIASREDFANLGIDYPNYLDNINVTLDRTFGQPQLRIDSSNVIVKEPFIHFLVRVDWSGGSFLREYTALIDPPVYASETPKSISAPKVVNTTPFQQAAPTYTRPDSSTRSFNSSPRVSQPTYTTSSTDARYGPVEAGETLSMVAEQLQREYPDLSIYQIMKVLFEQNRSAFINDNINGLIKGSILNVGDISSIRAVDIRDGKQFFADQTANWAGQVTTSSDNVKITQDQYNDSEDSILETINETVGENFQVGASTDTDSLISDSDSDTSDGEVIVLKRQVSELQSSLSSGAQENQDLKERISILEAQLADMQDLVSLGVEVENSSLASLEQSLAEANNSIEQEAGSLIGSVDEVVDDSVESANDALAEFTKDAEQSIGLTDDGLVEADGSNLEADGSIIDAPLIGEEVAIAEGGVNELDEPSAIEPVETSKPAPIVTNKPEPGLIEKVKTELFEGGIWKLVAGLGGFILAGVLAIFFIRRRRADEEFEISMLSIESNSQSVNTVDDPMLSRSMSASVTASVSQVEGADESQETSFLTVYSDSDAVVQADEVDPIAEADVYIAYGRHEQAEEVLLDGVANYPERADIKHKLLTVYHKNGNTEGFERIAEELYSNRDTLEPNVWQEICEMGKDVNPDNPLFELSAGDIETASVIAGDSEDEILADISDVLDDKELNTEDEDLINLDDAGDIAFDTEALNKLDADDSEVGDVDLDVSELDIADADDDSVQLINFDEGRSEISELDEVAISTLEFDTSLDTNDDSDSGDSLVADISLGDDDSSLVDDSLLADGADSDIEIDVDDEILEDDGLELDIELDDALEFSSNEIAADIDLNSDIEFDDLMADLDSDDDNEPNVGELTELSDLEVDDDYDELRTQYELAKVFSDLGDEDGARKILTDIIADDSADDLLVQESKELLESLS